MPWHQMKAFHMLTKVRFIAILMKTCNWCSEMGWCSESVLKSIHSYHSIFLPNICKTLALCPCVCCSFQARKGCQIGNSDFLNCRFQIIVFWQKLSCADWRCKMRDVLSLVNMHKRAKTCFYVYLATLMSGSPACISMFTVTSSLLLGSHSIH